MQNKRARWSLFTLAWITVCTTILGSAVRATSLFPWDNPYSVRALVTQQPPDGQNVTCRGVLVDRISARTDPPYIVIRDAVASGAKLVVICRPPVDLQCEESLDVEGTIRTLPNGERCIDGPVALYGYFDQNGRRLPLLPPGVDEPWCTRAPLPLPTGPIAPSDPSLADDGMGVACEPTATAPDGALRFNTVASLLASAPPLLARVELTGRRVTSSGQRFLVLGDDATSATVKVFTKAAARGTDRALFVSATVHSEGGRVVLYADSGPVPYYDDQVGGDVRLARSGTAAYGATLEDSPPTGLVPEGATTVVAVDPDAEDYSWTYLTGQIVTYLGRYYSHSLSSPDWIDVYNV